MVALSGRFRERGITRYQNHGEFAEFQRPFVATGVSESTLKDRPLESFEITRVKEAFADASKLGKVPVQGRAIGPCGSGVRSAPGAQTLLRRATEEPVAGAGRIAAWCAKSHRHEGGREQR